jgi:hypothetical protein
MHGEMNRVATKEEEEEEAAPFAKSVTREFTHTKKKVGMNGKPERRNRMHGMHDESYPHVVLI